MHWYRNIGCLLQCLVTVGQKNWCPCVIHAGLLGPKQDLDASSIKMGDARSCQLISMGMVGKALCLCATNRKKVSVFELNPKKLQYSKLMVVADTMIISNVNTLYIHLGVQCFPYHPVGEIVEWSVVCRPCVWLHDIQCPRQQDTTE